MGLGPPPNLSCAQWSKALRSVSVTIKQCYNRRAFSYFLALSEPLVLLVKKLDAASKSLKVFVDLYLQHYNPRPCQL